MTRRFIDTKDLPASLRSALGAVEYHKGSVAVEASERVTLLDMGGDGFQAFAVLVDMATGQHEIHRGSWGGPNAYALTAVDADRREHTLPVNGAVIRGRRGGGRPVSATVTVHPDALAKLLPAGESYVTETEARILGYFVAYKPAYRKEQLARIPHAAELIEGLIARGMIKRNAAGATQITTEGKNHAARVY